LVRLHGSVANGLFATERLWAPLQTAQGWLRQATQVLANPDEADAATVERAYRDLLAEALTAQADDALAPWATHFYKVTRNYWPGLFHCYDRPEIPRTNNDLEHYFGTARHHERRATGQKRPPAAVAVRGSVRVVAAVASQVMHFAAVDLRPADLEQWHSLRAELEGRHARRLGRAASGVTQPATSPPWRPSYSGRVCRHSFHNHNNMLPITRT
jgi:hypothetical protein